MANLLDGVLGSTQRTEPVGARVEVRLEDWLEDQLHAGLHASIPRGRDAEAAEFPVRLGDHPLTRGQRHEPPRLEIISQQSEERLRHRVEVARRNAVDPGRACSSIAPHTIPRHRQEGGVADEVKQVIEPTLRVVGRPLVQLGLNSQYPDPASSSVGHGASVFTGDLLACPVLLLRPAGSLRHVAGFPGLGLLRILRPARGHQPTTGLPATTLAAGGQGDSRVVPTFTTSPSWGGRPALPLAASPRVRRRPSSWPHHRLH